MSNLKDEQVDYIIAPPESLSIIGSNSINTSGDLYVIDINSIIKRANRRNKRMLDFLVSLTLLIFYPIFLFLVKKPIGLFRNIFSVLFAWKSWVGFSPHTELEMHRLPEIKQGVLNPLDAFKHKHMPEEAIARLDLLYARDYKLTNDLNIVIKGYRNLGRQ
jgi:lipopolysaccharide/colanic/teichoic acid biosynthesis glycosyltransferase